jgi:hypothetical protein
MPKEVAAANQMADVSVNALAVGFPVEPFSIASSDKMKTPLTLRVDIVYRLNGDVIRFNLIRRS